MRGNKSHLRVARNVFRIEAAAILDLGTRLSASFNRAVEAIYACRGRVIVCGMGKPGIIGRKIQATFASIGIPSLSMHPAEAVHGDLGMVTAEDVVLALSSSGETEEMLRFVPVVKKIGALLIALTGAPRSSLAVHSDIVLDVGVAREACPLGLAPTASTTAMLAMGDALAVALIGRKRLKPEEFALYHPAGALGRRLLKVADVMRTGKANPIVGTGTRVKEVLLAITRARAGAATVVDSSGKLAGIFTDGDLRRAFEARGDIASRPIRDFMIRNPITIGPGRLAVEALRVMRGDNPKGRKLDELPVTDATRRPVGMLDVVDLIGIG
ncbi:MAG: KpsF/GutQ family sugar-phosphate isomerase [Candidatus Aureabacteria bacterium]|nr:KpsF/GutQ family sugar-phosphate isomerase [Candidatus Auribacterota bacterium]NLW93206.1 KpsF/GutQ family sugar-phosphate isomerase [Chlamydiota bacterium]HOE27474.1 KpsF/GutQ family sugar-phosphate isomerase [bacterium]HQM52240.1 KpsF/GutQ family sugar-phosphate isomerase [bacterium]